MFYSRADPVGVKLVNLAKLLSPVIVVISCPIYFHESVKRTTPGVYRISLEGSGTYMMAPRRGRAYGTRRPASKFSRNQERDYNTASSGLHPKVF